MILGAEPQAATILLREPHRSDRLPTIRTTMSLVDYPSSDEDGAGPSYTGASSFTSATKLVAAPDVSLEVE